MQKADPIDRIMQSTFNISRVFRQRMMGAHAESGEDAGATNFLQMHALLIIEEHKGLTMKELAESLHVASPSATALVNRLVKLSWIERMPDPKNRKLVRVKLTEGGKKFLKRKHQKRREIMQELFQFLTPQEQETLASLNEKILAHHEQRMHHQS
jgi:DNA-binding MarR family transcriptional regulator